LLLGISSRVGVELRNWHRLNPWTIIIVLNGRGKLRLLPHLIPPQTHSISRNRWWGVRVLLGFIPNLQWGCEGVRVGSERVGVGGEVVCGGGDWEHRKGTVDQLGCDWGNSVPGDEIPGSQPLLPLGGVIAEQAEGGGGLGEVGQDLGDQLVGLFVKDQLAGGKSRSFSNQHISPL